MNISEAIEHLEILRDKYGNLDITTKNEIMVGPFEIVYRDEELDGMEMVVPKDGAFKDKKVIRLHFY